MKQYHKIICAAYLLPEKEGEVLLLRRLNTGFEDGSYSLVSGHLNDEESVRQAMIREAKEEAGIDINPEDLELVHVMHRNELNGDEARIDFFFKCRSWQGDITNMEPEKCDDLSWFSLNELPINIIQYIKTALEHVNKGQFYSELYW